MPSGAGICPIGLDLETHPQVSPGMERHLRNWVDRLAQSRHGRWPLVALVALVGLPPSARLFLSWQVPPSQEARNQAAANANGSGLFVVGIDGTGLRLVASAQGFFLAAYPAWSPEGDRLAFTAFDATGRQPEIRIVPVSGGESRVVGRGVAPSWSSDGTKLAYMVSGKPPIAVDWSRLGSNDERIEILNVEGPRAGEVEALGPGMWPRFSPRDDRLALVQRNRSSWDIYVRSADRLDLTRLTDDPSQDTMPIWRADASAVVFLSNRGNRWDLYECPSTGGPLRRLSTNPRREDHPSLNPEGTRVAFADDLSRSRSQILLLDLTTDTSTVLLPGSMDDRDPAWSPDGKWIAFTSKRPWRGF